VNAPGDQDSNLESAIGGLYGGSLEDFVRRRDSLAKELRAAGRRESASVVKDLRKPSRVAWALDLAAQDSREAIDKLDAALAETLNAHAGTGNVRAAIVGLRAAVREFAGKAAHAAERAGLNIESGVLANAVLAVLGRPGSLNQLRRGYLAEIPEAGGLDFLATLPTPPEQVPPSTPTQPRPPANLPSPPPGRAELETAVREAAQRAGIVLTDARGRSEVAQRALRDAESSLRVAEARLREAEEKADAMRGQVDRARQKAEATAAELIEAKSAAAEAERQLNDVSRQR
jgi:hypothetical protein